MFRMKRNIDFLELKKIEEKCQRNILTQITPIKQKLEDAGYVVEYQFINVKNKSVRKRVFHTCELSIYPNHISKRKAKKQFKLKIFRFFLYEKVLEKKNTVNVMLRNELCFRLFVTFSLKQIIVGNIDKMAKDNIFDFFSRVFFPSRTGELAFMFRGKDFEWIRVLMFFAVSLIIGILAAVKRADLLSSLGY